MNTNSVNPLPSLMSPQFSSSQISTADMEEIKSQFTSMFESNLKGRSTPEDSESRMRRSDYHNPTKNPITPQNAILTDDCKENSLDLSGIKKKNNPDGFMALNLLINEIVNVTKSKFDISDDELEKAMEKVGATYVDLFDPNQLTLLFLELSGESDLSALLTDEMLAFDLQGFLESIQSMGSLEELGFTVEQLKELEMIKPLFTNSDTVSNENEHLELDVENELDTGLMDEKMEVIDEPKENAEQSSKDHESTKREKEDKIEFAVNGSNHVSNQTKVEFINRLATTTQSREIVEQIVQQIKVNISPNHTSLEMVLTPETLGKINLSVTSKNGIMTAHMIAQTHAAKDAIESQLAILKETFNNRGLKVEKVEVTVAGEQFDFMNDSHMQQSNQQQQSSKRSGSHIRMVMEDKSDEIQPVEPSAVSVSIGKGTQLDLNA